MHMLNLFLLLSAHYSLRLLFLVTVGAGKLVHVTVALDNFGAFAYIMTNKRNTFLVFL
jgi:hypothetical protein